MNMCSYSPVILQVPPNVKFEIDDIEKEWSHSQPFDFIFSRYMAGSIGDWPALATNAYRNLKPGGWVEFQDYDSVYFSDDGSLKPEHDMTKWLDTLREACRDAKRDCDPGPRLEKYVKEAGFVNVHHEVFKCPVGGWPKDKSLVGACDGSAEETAHTYTTVEAVWLDESDPITRGPRGLLLPHIHRHAPVGGRRGERVPGQGAE